MRVSPPPIRPPILPVHKLYLFVFPFRLALFPVAQIHHGDFRDRMDQRGGDRRWYGGADAGA